MSEKQQPMKVSLESQKFLEPTLLPTPLLIDSERTFAEDHERVDTQTDGE